MADREHYQHNVLEAQRMAENSWSDRHKAAWLHIADQWLGMLEAYIGPCLLPGRRSRYVPPPFPKTPCMAPANVCQRIA